MTHHIAQTGNGGKRALWSRLNVTAKILVVFLALSIASLVLTGSIALITISGVGEYALESGISLGNRAVNDSTTALEQNAEESLLRLAQDQAAISNTLFEQVEAETKVMAAFASSLMNETPSLPATPSHAQYERPEDIYACSSYVLAPDVTVEQVGEELNRSSTMDTIFIPIYASDPHAQWVYIGTESGILRVYPWCTGIDPSFDPRTRAWYRKARETGAICWSEPMVDAGGGGLTVTCSKPLCSSDERWFWVICLDVTIETINQDIINTQIGDAGYALLIDGAGNVIARPGLSAGDRKWDESFETENLLRSNISDLRAIAAHMTAGETGIGRCRFEDGEKYIAYAPIRCTKWSVGVVMPVEEIVAPALATKSKIIAATEDTSEHVYQQMARMQKIFGGVFIALILVVAGLSVSLARIITNPVRALKHGSEALGKGDLDYKVEVKTGDEFEELAESFNQMASDLKTHMNELRRTTAEKERMAKELEIAKGIQQSFLPDSIPEIPGIDLAALNLPALEVGGDFYDFIPITTDRWGLAIADVSGKGVPAALFMALSRTLIRASTARNPATVNAIKQANRLICEDSKTSMFVTLFYAILDANKMTLTYVNAGHNPPLLFRSGATDIALLEAKGIAWGVIEQVDLEEVELGLKRGDTVVLYTDGVTEALNDAGEEFGSARLMAVLSAQSGSSARELIVQIRDAIQAFTGNPPQFDDITLMVVKAK